MVFIAVFTSSFTAHRQTSLDGKPSCQRCYSITLRRRSQKVKLSFRDIRLSKRDIAARSDLTTTILRLSEPGGGIGLPVTRFGVAESFCETQRAYAVGR